MIGRRARLVLVPLALLGVACGPNTAAPRPGPTPVAYVNAALDLIQRNAYYRDRLNWPRVRAQADAVAAHARSTIDTYPEITAVLAQLGDHHSHLVPPGLTQTANTEALPGEQQPTGTQLPGGITELTVPAETANKPAAIAQYIDLAEQAVRAGVRAGSCGWIVELRGNTGGSVWPMLAAVAPLLGEGTAGSFVDPTGHRTPWTLHGGVWTAGTSTYPTQRNPLPTIDDGKAPVAVLTDERTASAGEAVAVAFRGRPNTRSFGQPTAGVPTGNATYHLPDGAALAIMEALDADRTGTSYNGPIPPDQPTTSNLAIGGPDPTLTAATNWLTPQPACQH